MVILKINVNEINEKIKSQSVFHIYEDFRIVTYKNILPNRYLIGEFGTVFDMEREVIVSQFRDTRKSKGYYRLGLRTIDSGRKKFSVHRLVAWEYCDGYDELTDFTMVNHKNAYTGDNYYKNLEWCDHSHNMKHKFRNGHYYNSRRKFDEKTVHYICQELEKGVGVADICRTITGVKYPRREARAIYDTVQKIHIKRLYVDIASKYNF